MLVLEDDRNNRLAGEHDGRSGDTLPASLSLDVEDGGVGGSENPISTTSEINSFEKKFGSI